MILAITLTNETNRPSLTEGEIRAIGEPLLVQCGLAGEWLVDVRLIDMETMRQLNREAQGLNEPTDVLSFPVHFATDRVDPHRQLPPAGTQLLGSLVICPAVASEQAPHHGRTVDDELRFLVEHGIRHLLGYDHDDQARWLPRSTSRAT